ncbi:uncharacterized protein LOC134774486 [Penaeus indicus]|uniref:uncharacterized protein LOC134774486 n=1 Tax=Penaeus indicus TaxID=29960 RepID=UPI00300D7A8F
MASAVGAVLDEGESFGDVVDEYFSFIYDEATDDGVSDTEESEADGVGRGSCMDITYQVQDPIYQNLWRRGESVKPKDVPSGAGVEASSSSNAASRDQRKPKAFLKTDEGVVGMATSAQGSFRDIEQNRIQGFDSFSEPVTDSVSSRSGAPAGIENSGEVANLSPTAGQLARPASAAPVSINISAATNTISTSSHFEAPTTASTQPGVRLADVRGKSVVQLPSGPVMGDHKAVASHQVSPSSKQTIYINGDAPDRGSGATSVYLVGQGAASPAQDVTLEPAVTAPITIQVSQSPAEQDPACNEASRASVTTGLEARDVGRFLEEVHTPLLAEEARRAAGGGSAYAMEAPPDLVRDSAPHAGERALNIGAIECEILDELFEDMMLKESKTSPPVGAQVVDMSSPACMNGVSSSPDSPIDCLINGLPRYCHGRGDEDGLAEITLPPAESEPPILGEYKAALEAPEAEFCVTPTDGKCLDDEECSEALVESWKYVPGGDASGDEWPLQLPTDASASPKEGEAQIRNGSSVDFLLCPEEEGAGRFRSTFRDPWESEDGLRGHETQPPEELQAPSQAQTPVANNLCDLASLSRDEPINIHSDILSGVKEPQSVGKMSLANVDTLANAHNKCASDVDAALSYKNSFVNQEIPTTTNSFPFVEPIKPLNSSDVTNSAQEMLASSSDILRTDQGAPLNLLPDLVQLSDSTSTPAQSPPSPPAECDERGECSWHELGGGRAEAGACATSDGDGDRISESAQDGPASPGSSAGKALPSDDEGTAPCPPDSDADENDGTGLAAAMSRVVRRSMRRMRRLRLSGRRSPNRGHKSAEDAPASTSEETEGRRTVPAAPAVGLPTVRSPAAASIIVSSLVAALAPPPLHAHPREILDPPPTEAPALSNGVSDSQPDGGQAGAAAGDKRQRRSRHRRSGSRGRRDPSSESAAPSPPLSLEVEVGGYAPSAPPSIDVLPLSPSSPPPLVEATPSPIPSAPPSLEDALLTTEGSRGERGSAAPRPVPLASPPPFPSAPAAALARSSATSPSRAPTTTSPIRAPTTTPSSRPSSATALPRPSTTISIPRPSTTSPSRPSAAPIPRPQVTTTRHTSRPTTTPSAATSPAHSARLASPPPPSATEGTASNARRGHNQRRRQRRRGDSNNNNSATSTTDRATAGTTTAANDARSRNANSNNSNNNNNNSTANNNNVRDSPRRNAYAGSSSGAGLEAERLRVQGGTWTHSHSGLMSSLAVTVTTFNISRFAVLGARFGWPFVVQWGVVSLVLGLPLMTFHMTVGQYLGAGVVDMWRISPIFQGVGYSLALAQALLGVYCCVPIAWLFIYFRDSFSIYKGMFRWTDCRMLNCSLQDNFSLIIEGVPLYFNSQVLQRNAGNTSWLQDLGSLKFDMAFNIALIWIITLIALSRGNQLYGKVCYIIFLLPLLCYLVVCLYLASSTKYDIYMNGTSFNDIFTSSRSWMAASREVFLVWGVHGAVLQQMSAHNKRGHPLYRDTTIVCLITTLALVLAAVTGLSCVSGLQHHYFNYKPSSFERTETAQFLSSTHFQQSQQTQEPLLPFQKTNEPPTIEYMHYDNFYAGIRIRTHRSMNINPVARKEEYDTSGYQSLRLATELFPALLGVYGSDKISPFWSSLFFLSLLLFGIAQQLAMWRTVVEAVIRINQERLQAWETFITFLCCVFGFSAALPMATGAGIQIIYFLDYVVSCGWWLMIIQLVQIFALLFVRGKPYSGHDIVSELMGKSDQCRSLWLGPLTSFAWNIIVPVGLLVLSISSFKSGQFREVFAWGNNSYWSTWVCQLASAMQLFPILLVPLVGLIQTCRYLASTDDDLFERIQLLYRPSLRQRTSGNSFMSVTEESEVDGLEGSREGQGEQGANVTPRPYSDPPPKYTPPPSYSTATGVRFAKLLNQSLRQSMRRLRDTLRSNVETNVATDTEATAQLEECHITETQVRTSTPYIPPPDYVTAVSECAPDRSQSSTSTEPPPRYSTLDPLRRQQALAALGNSLASGSHVKADGDTDQALPTTSELQRDNSLRRSGLRRSIASGVRRSARRLAATLGVGGGEDGATLVNSEVPLSQDSQQGGENEESHPYAFTNFELVSQSDA